MDVLEAGTRETAVRRRCHIWCWAPAGQPPQPERRTLLVGGLSPFGLTVGAMTALLSAAGNRRRQRDAIATAAPTWRYVGSGTGEVVGGRLAISEPSGIVRWFDPRTVTSLDAPAAGWLRVQQAGSTAAWAIQIM